MDLLCLIDREGTKRSYDVTMGNGGGLLWRECCLSTKLRILLKKMKGKKSKASPGREPVSSRLLWNSNGNWKDNWFIYEDGMLSGYKEQGVKPPEVTINIKTSKLTIYGADEFMRKLNLFKITTVCNVPHIFAAWNEEQYELWVEVLSYAVGKNYEQVSFNNGNDRRLEDEQFDNDIIPYERALDKERRVKEKSKRMDRIDNIDSGNDGDESGLESSVSSLSLFESRKRSEKERREFARTGSYSSIPEINTTNNDSNSKLFNRSLSDKDLHHLKDTKKCSVTSAPSLEYEVYPQRPQSLVISRNGRNTPDKSKQRTKESNEGGEYLQVTGGKGNVEISITKTSSRNQTTPVHERGDSNLSTASDYYNQEQRHSRQCSTDTYLHLNDVAIDSSSSGHTIDTPDGTTGHQKYSVGSFCSDENISDFQMSSNRLSPTSADKDKLEECLTHEQNQTLLRKRRNSLTLSRDHVKDTLDELRVRERRNSKDVIDSCIDKTSQIDQLENKMCDLEKEIKNIDRKISVTPGFEHMTPCNVKKRKPSQHKQYANNIMSKIRGAKPNLLVHSHSIESLTSTASHDSSVGRSDSPYTDHRNSYTPTVRTVKEGASDDSVENSPSSPNELGSSPSSPNGLEELMRTTQRLENGEFPKVKRNESEPIGNMSSRSKSMSSVDKISSRNSNNNNSKSTHHTHNIANAELIIEDFEKFSATWMKNHHSKTVKSTEVIDV